MENVVLIIHLLLALALVAVVLLQRSEGGGLGMGGGGGAMTASRSQATALSKVTWMLATAFIITSITLTIIAAQNASGTSVIDQLGITPPALEEGEATTDPILPPAGSLLPPSADETGPLVPLAD